MLQNSDIYKKENIQLHTNWLNSISECSGSLVKEVEIFDPTSEHLSNDNEANIVAESHSTESNADNVTFYTTHADKKM